MVKKKMKQVVVILVSLFFCAMTFFGGVDVNTIHAFAEEDVNDSGVLYLSDTSRITHDASKSTSYGNSRLFMAPSGVKNIPGGAIQVKIENAWYTFENGIYAHGPSYVAFNIEKYTSQGYKWFTAYGGLLPSASKSDGAIFHIDYSEDGKTWSTFNVEPDDPTVHVEKPVDGYILIKYNQNAQYYEINVEGVKWLRIGANKNKSNSQDYVVFADAKLSKTLDAGEEVPSISSLDSKIKNEVNNGKDVADRTLELLILQRELISRMTGQYALKRFLGESADNKAMWKWLFNDLDSLREFLMGGTPFKGNYYNSLSVLSGLYKRYKKDLSITDKLKNNKINPDRTFGELCRTMMFSVALTHDGPIGSYLQGSKPENASDPYRRYAIFKYMYQTERFVALRNADGSWKSETMTMFGNMEVEEMRWLMCNIIDDESIIWLNDYVQTRINAANNVGSLYTPHSYVRYTNPNYGNPVFYADENYDYFNSLFSVDSREVIVDGKVIVKDDNYGKVLSDDLVANSQHKNTNIKHYGLWDAEYHVPAGEGEEPYVIKVSRSGENEAHIQKVWMNFNNKFKTGSVCGGISKSGNNIRTSRGIPANVIGQPGHAAILYYSMDANGNGNWKIDNDVGGWLAATKGERHLLGWGNAAWQRNSGGTVVYFHLAQACLNDYDNLVRAEEYCWLAKVYAGDLDKQERLYGSALAVQPMNLDAWYGLTTTFMANSAKTATNFCSLVDRIADTLWNHPVAMHCLFRVLNASENPKPEATTSQRLDTVFVSQMRTVEVNALAKAKASGSSAAKSKVNYFLGNTDTSVADFSFDGDNAGCIVWSDTYKGSGFRWRYSLDGKKTWSDEIVFTGDEKAPIYELPGNQINAISSDNDIYVYIVGADPNNAYKIEVSTKPALPDVVYANDWENRFIGVDGTYEWRYCSSSTKETETDIVTTYTPTSNWRSFADATPDCTGNVAIEVRIKGTSKNPASDSKVFTFTKDDDDPTKKYISIDYLSMEGFSTQSQDAKRPNYAENAIDGNANTYWHTDYSKSLKAPVSTDKDGNATFDRAYLVIKLDVPRWISNLEFSQRQYNSAFSIFAKTVNVYVSQDGKTWGDPAAIRTDLENMANLNVVNFENPVYGQYIKIEMAQLWETNTNDGVFTTVSLINIYEDTTKKTTPDGKDVPSLSTVTPSKDSTAGFGAVVSYNSIEGEEIKEDKAFEGIHASNASAGVFATTFDDVFADYSDKYADNTFEEIFVDIPGIISGDNPGDNPGDNSDNSSDNNSGNDKNTTGIGLAVALSVVGVVLVAGAVVFVLYKRGIIKFNKSSKPETTTANAAKSKTTTTETKASAVKPKTTNA